MLIILFGIILAEGYLNNLIKFYRMAHNPVENYFLAEAIRTLRPRYEAVYGPREHFYLSRGGVRFMLME